MPAQRKMKSKTVFTAEGAEGGHYTKVEKIVASGPAVPDQEKRPTRCGTCLTAYKPPKGGNPKKEFRTMLEQGWVIDAEAMTLRCPSCAGSQSPS